MKNTLTLLISFCLTTGAAFSQQKTATAPLNVKEKIPVQIKATQALPSTPDAPQNLPVDYVFTGDGAWSFAPNWNNGLVPPPTTNPGSTISIYPNPNIVGSQCVLDIPYSVTPMTSFTVIANSSLVVKSLIVQ
ncbi:MAG: hypothetical protein ABIN25_08855 [Ginsengibacter sp.]